ncbi:MAG TPA: PD-(D/E)XK nuclease family protein, partial [Sphingobacteriaceae bacterium]|nr:PD-(D/E)XK nuclease family protein [Sphingobacteriaceae bacterium]
MKSFLSEVSQAIYSKHQDKLANVILVLPSKRAATILKNEFLQTVHITSISPVIYSIEEFIQELAHLKLAGNIQLLFEFYHLYKELTPKDQQEDFYHFISWAQTLLQDFNEIDRYLLDSDSFFTHLFNVKELDQFHWTNTEDKTPLQKNYLKLWEKMHHYYTTLNEHLSDQGLAYQGAIYKEAYANSSGYLLKNSNRHHYFIGFNALNTAEQSIFQEFLAAGNTTIYWDLDKKFLEEPVHDAGLFIRKYKNTWPYYKTHKFEYISDHYQKPKQIEIIGTPKNVGQTKYIGHILESNNLEAHKTAIVLANESLLTPLLGSLPDSLEVANITSGFPLALTPLGSFFETLLEVWENKSSGTWYYKDISAVLTNPVTQMLLDKHWEEIESLLSVIKQENAVYVPDHLLVTIPELKLLFPREKKLVMSDVIDNCLEIITQLRDRYQKEKNALFLEYLFGCYQVFNQLQQFNNTYRSITDIRSLRKVYSATLQLQTVDFKGEPVQGLQIMGMLESRNLDFETVIISSVNEGILPAGKTHNSFIPMDLKVAFGLPTFKEKDAIYTYHFYRLLQRAKNVYILYNTEPDSLEGGEKSRLIHQLCMLPEANHNIVEKIATAEIKNDKRALLSIAKDATLMEALKRVAEKGFSPTSLTTYIRNPLDFYSRSILGIREVEEVEETIAANTLGTIVHDTLEYFYKPLEGQYLSLEHINDMRSMVDVKVKNFFSQTYTSVDKLQGKNLISFHIAKRYIENFLTFEEDRLQQGK